MKPTLKHFCITGAILPFLLLTQLSGAVQQPKSQPRTAEQAFKNIKVIKSMPASQLQGAMSFMAASLGVDCSHCHAPPAMEKDEKPAKETARRMLALVNEINRTFGDKPMVTCATCHRGQIRPVTVPPLMALTIPLNLPGKIDQSDLPAVDVILDRYVRSIGGEKALNKITTRTRKGSVQIAGINGSFELQEAAPNRSLLVGKLPPPWGSVHQGFDGTMGWVKNQNGVFEMSGEGLKHARREADFHFDTKLKEQYSAMRVLRRERIPGREFYVIEGTRGDGQVEQLYFEVLSGLLARRYWETQTYFGPLPSAIDYDDYRKVGGVSWPFVIRRSRSGTTFLQTTAELKVNAPVDETIFKKPAASN